MGTRLLQLKLCGSSPALMERCCCLTCMCHRTAAPPISFPDSDAGLPNQYAKLLFNMSSTLPEHMRSYAQQQGVAVSEGTRGFVFNADMTSIVQFLDIGTRASDLR